MDETVEATTSAFAFWRAIYPFHLAERRGQPITDKLEKEVNDAIAECRRKLIHLVDCAYAKGYQEQGAGSAVTHAYRKQHEKEAT